MSSLNLAKETSPAVANAAKGPRRTRDEVEFLPALLETIERGPSPTIQWSIAVLLVLVVGTITWASVAHLDVVAVAPGKLVPAGRVKVVQALETARIAAIHVDDGQHVDAGEPLVDLDATDVTSDITSTSNDLFRASLDGEEARLELVETAPTLAEFRAPPDAPQKLVEASLRQALSERAKVAATIDGYRADIAEKQAIIKATEFARKAADDAIPLLSQKFQIYNDLYKQGAWQHVDALDANEALLEKQVARDTADQTVLETEAQIRSLETKISEAIASSQADAMDREAKADAKTVELSAELAKSRQKLQDRHLVASVAGTIENVKVHTLGEVVTVADTLMTIVPDGTRLEVEADIGNDDIGFVTEGQKVALKVEAFPFTRYGLIEGTLAKVSRDATTEKPISDAPPTTQNGPSSNSSAAVDTSQLTYPVLIALNQDWIRTERGEQKLQAGMKVNAEIKTGERRVIEFLLSPVMTMVTEAGRER